MKATAPRPVARLYNTVDTGFTVEYTDDLNIFNDIEANRDVVKGHVDMLARAMNKKLLYAPLYVNDDMAILDGQHRIAALKRRNKLDTEKFGTYYIKFTGMGYDASTIPVYNTNAVNWKTNDYIDTYCSQSNENFMRLRHFMRYTQRQLDVGGASIIPTKVPFSAGLAMILLVGKEDLTPVKNGTAIITQAQVDRAIELFDCLLDFKNANLAVWKQKKFIVAFKQFATKSYKRSVMQKQLATGKGTDHFTPKNKVENYREQISDMYNGLV